MKKVVTFLLLILAVAGILGGLGYTYYEGAYPISIGILVLGYLAYPKAKELFDILWYE